MKIIDINSIPRGFADINKKKETLMRSIKRYKSIMCILIFFVSLLLMASLAGWFYLEARNVKAQDDIFQAIYHFEANDFDKALEGDSLHKGFLAVIKQYPYTKTANLACFYAGTSYMHQKEYDKALSFLSRFRTRDYILQARAWCVMGDAHSEQKNHKQAAIYYMKAARYKPNSVYTPGYLVKAAIASEVANQYRDAYHCYQEVLEKYPESQYGSALAIKEAGRLSAYL